MGTWSSSAPARSSSRMPSENISLQILSPRRGVSARSVASGIEPMPSWSVEPSTTLWAMRSPMASAAWSGSFAEWCTSGSSTSQR